MPARRLLPLLVLWLALGLAACGSGDGDDGAAGKPGAAVDNQEAGCREVEAPAPRSAPELARPKLALDPSRTWRAEVSTNCGDFTIELDVDRAPKTASSFAALARSRYFDGLTFHRIVSGFVIQGGDPTGTGQGGPGYSVREAPPQDLAYTRGVVAMAKTPAEPPGTSGSQFFVVTAEDADLEPEYALLGTVTEGQEVVDAIGVVAVNPDETPVDPVVIDSVEIVER